jgi:transcriptional regulator with XRE-family HTH domain
MTRTPPLHVQLRRMRKKRGLTIEHVARKASTTTYILENIENGDWGLYSMELRRLLKALGCYCIINGPDGAFVVRERQEER